MGLVCQTKSCLYNEWYTRVLEYDMPNKKSRFYFDTNAPNFLFGTSYFESILLRGRGYLAATSPPQTPNKVLCEKSMVFSAISKGALYLISGVVVYLRAP